MLNPLKRVLIAARRRFVHSRLQASLVTWMAQTGEGADECLKQGSLPLPVHFYSPVPDLEDLKERKVWDVRSELRGIDFRPDAQAAYLLRLGEEYGRECAWPARPNRDGSGFFTENNYFSFGCAAAAHCIIRDHGPRRLIEVGSGNSSMIISAALDMNEADGAPAAMYTVIDPYPSERLETLPGTRPKVIAERVELSDPSLFEQLERGDVLFIDSGHVVRIGGDVNFLFLDILPRLQPGVIVHFHDIDLPYEYPEVYLTNPLRMIWTESYLLQAFLSCNSEFEVLLGMKYLMLDRPDAFREAFPAYDPARHTSVSGSFWIARR